MDYKSIIFYTSRCPLEHLEEQGNELGVTKLSFTYDDRGFRLSKKDYGTGKVTYYIRDASGSLLSLYDNGTAGTIDQKEGYNLRFHPIFLKAYILL